MKSVYLETSIFSYLTARPSRDVLTAARQHLTEQWWHDHRHRFELFASGVVDDEAREGDPEAAERRLSAMSGIPQAVQNEEADRLAERLVRDRAVPEVATDDAIHIAIAAVHGLDYLLTWNFRHIDNAETKPAIRAICEAMGYSCPEICTPEELMGGLSDEG